VSPVLTAHPTEVQRKSILDAERDIAQLLAGTRRDQGPAAGSRKDALAPRELAANEAQIRARVLQLWQTRLLRFTKLTVADEIENALSYYEATFLREIPRSTPTWSASWATSRSRASCAWASGSAATATATPTSAPRRWTYALRRQAEVALRHYLTEVHWLGSELSLSAMLVDCTPEMRRWPTLARHQRASPGRALPTRPDRHVRPAGRHAEGPDRRRRRAPRGGAAEPLPAGREFLADLRTIEASLLAHHGAALVAQRLQPLIRAVEVFGFHLATVDLRQSSDQHELVVAELLAAARIEPHYAQPARERARALLLRC
jgi:phosphoenolpyruvate carboxylase